MAIISFIFYFPFLFFLDINGTAINMAQIMAKLIPRGVRFVPKIGSD